MPAADKDVLQRAIKDGGINVICIDTQVFIKHGLNFNDIALDSIKQFKNTDIQICITDIIYQEVKSHLKDKLMETILDLKKSAEKYQNKWGSKSLDVSAINDLDRAQNFDLISRQILDEFIEKSDILILPTDKVNVNFVFHKYFCAEPPFEAGNKKKHEFPDAFSLETIEEYSKNNGQAIILSEDNGWKIFANSSENLYSFDDLAELLNIFQHHPEIITKIAQNIMQFSRNDKIYEDILKEVNEFLWNVSLDGSADYHLDLELLTIEVDTLSFEDMDTIAVIYIDDDEFRFTAEILVEVVGEYMATFSVYDSVDKDFTTLSEESSSFKKEMTLDIIISVKKSEPHRIDRVSVQSRYVEIRLGYLEPDW